MKEQRIRTLLIEDSSFMRRVIGDILKSEESIDLIGEASNGKEGVEMVLDLKPDVVITDMVMPEYDGMYLVRSVMERQPVPIILLSSLDKANARIFDALRFGAFEFIDKPSDLDASAIKNYSLISLVKHAYSTDISLLKAKQNQEQKSVSLKNWVSSNEYPRVDAVFIGASTGGPGAIESILVNLPKYLSTPVVIAQHMPARFLETFASRLNGLGIHPVKIAEDGEVLKKGIVYIAPGERNIRLERNGTNVSFGFTTEEFEEFNFPSINCLFESVANVYKDRCLGIILTGMGKDGMYGLKKIRDVGGYTIAQDESSSVVYGMPKAALNFDAVTKVLNLSEIPGFIFNCL